MSSEQLLSDYKHYYKVRMMRYQNDPLYTHSYKAESTMYQLFADANSMEELMSQQQNGIELSNKVAIALMKDIAQMELDWCKKHQETIKILAPQRVLEEIDKCTTIADTVQLTIDIEMSILEKVAIDRLTAETVFKVINQLIKIEENSNLTFNRDEYKESTEMLLKKLKENIIFILKELNENASLRLPDWSFDAFIIKEHRHKKGIIYSEKHIDEKCAEINKIWKEEIQ